MSVTEPGLHYYCKTPNHIPYVTDVLEIFLKRNMRIMNVVVTWSRDTYRLIYSSHINPLGWDFRPSISGTACYIYRSR